MTATSDQAEDRPHICIVAHLAYGAMTGGASGHIGGVERQTSMMARWLARHGYPVSLLTWDDGQDDEVVIDGVRVLKMCRRDAGLPGLRFVHPRWTSLVRAMRRADAQVYYHNCGEYVTGQVALWCRRHDRGFVYSVANDMECDPQLPDMKTIRERVLYRFGLRHADAVIAQTRTQKKMLQEGFGVDSTVIPMPCWDSQDEHDGPPRSPDARGDRVLWIARITEQKRPDRLVDLARACPDFRFDLVGPSEGTDYADRACRQAGTLDNVTVHGPAPRERVADFYRQAVCLCCTSDYEGFPNTFLEAWSYGVPVVSTVDPDGLIAERGLGAVAEDAEGLAAAIRRLIESPDDWRQASANARQYYLDNHAPQTVLPRFERVFLDAARAARH